MAIKFIDLFAGIGGFHQALSFYGLECVFASEWDKHASLTYEENYKIKPAGDVTKINEKDIPNHDLLCGGFPCQAFSISGRQRGFDDERGNLFFDIIRIAKYHKPKIIFLENVKNFAKHDSGNTLRVVLNSLDKLGYKVKYKVINASNFSLPQNRERIFIVSIRKDLKSEKFDFPQNHSTKTSLYEIIENNPIETKVVDRPDIFFKKKNYKPQKDEFGKYIYPNKPIQIGYINKGGQGERIYSPYGHAVTLSAYGGGVGAKTGLYLINGKIRKLSLRECARVQGFPDSFKIISSSSQAYKQFGNSLAINVVKDIFKYILKSNVFES